MHPQAQLPQSAAQRNAQAQQKKDQPEEFSQYQKYQEVSNVPLALFTVMLTAISNSAASRSKKSRQQPHRRPLRKHQSHLVQPSYRPSSHTIPAASWT